MSRPSEPRDSGVTTGVQSAESPAGRVESAARAGFDSQAPTKGQPVELPHSVCSELLALRAKAKSSLANNLCPDHRDKQHDKPCLACTIERLERKATERESVNDHEMVEAIQSFIDGLPPTSKSAFMLYSQRFGLARELLERFDIRRKSPEESGT